MIGCALTQGMGNISLRQEHAHNHHGQRGIETGDILGRCVQRALQIKDRQKIASPAATAMVAGFKNAFFRLIVFLSPVIR
jgi:hypothetical protein